MSVTQEEITSILKTVRHPAAGKDIVSLDLVKKLEVTEDNISFTLSFPSVNDPLKTSLKKACVKAIQNKFGENLKINIQLETEARLAGIVKEPEVLPGVKNFIAVASGKGGVGKSTVATNLAVAMALEGYSVGIIDADIFGPSLPKMFNIEEERPNATKINGKDYILPLEKYGVKVLSMGLFVNPNDATVWRGPMASNAFKQIMTDAHWGDLDYMFFDLPPGTSDIHLTLVQTLSVTGAVIVSTPQDVAIADAIKGINMFKGKNINVPVLGLIENMAWFTPEELPENKYYIFGKDGCKRLSKQFDVPLLGQIPLVQSIREGGDDGVPSAMQNSVVGNAFRDLAQNVAKQVEQRNQTSPPTQKVQMNR